MKRYKITFKDGKTGPIFADKYESRNDLHLFYNSDNKPHPDIFFQSSAVIKVEDWPMEKPKFFEPFWADKAKED